MPPARVVAVAPGSPAASTGIQPGDEVLALNGEAVRDVIRYQMQADEPVVELEVRRGGLEQLTVVEKPAGVPLGLELDSPVFDRVQTCDNHCPFCFIHQLPKGMRRSLYLKDDDYRLSFLYGNFTTLTRFTEADFERVVTEQLSPLYVSIHATEPDVRTKLLRNRRGATSLRWLGVLLDAGVEVHGQIVVCPGINDGTVLDDTLLGILDRFPRLATVGIVPLGVSDHTTEPDMREHSAAGAGAVLDTVARWQSRFRDALGRRLVFAADEYYVLAQRPFPDAGEYEGFPQHENGIGMARSFEADVRAALDGQPAAGIGPRAGFFAWVDGAPANGYRAPRVDATPADPARPRSEPSAPVAIVTGQYGEQVLTPLLPLLRGAAAAPVRLLPVRNAYFGGNIAVTGLLTGRDLCDALASEPPADRYLVPDVVLSRDRFLDGLAVADLPCAVEIVPTDGASLVAALRGDGGFADRRPRKRRLGRPPEQEPELATATECAPAGACDGANEET
jgi:putative radical SAM enzyme (TIGR03279 family)